MGRSTPLRSEKGDGQGNSIDFFVKRKLKVETLTLAEEAGTTRIHSAGQLRSLGLAPQPKEVEDFVQSWQKDPATAKRELIDRLLADRAYGERWATHWLGVVRFAESDGYRADGFRLNRLSLSGLRRQKPQSGQTLRPIRPGTSWRATRSIRKTLTT